MFWCADCVCVCVCVCGWVGGSSLHMPLHPQVEWQATLRTLDGSQALFVLWLSKPCICRASEADLVLWGSSSGRLDLEIDQVGWGIAWEKGDGHILDEQGERHLFCCWSALDHGKAFSVGILKQCVCVLVKRCKLFP